MKNVKSLLLSLSFITLTSGSLFARETAELMLGKVAELGCHRLERLVTLGKIDESYLTKFN